MNGREDLCDDRPMEGIKRMNDIPVYVAVIVILFAPVALAVWIVLLAPVVAWVAVSMILCGITQRDWFAPVRSLPRLKR